MNEYPGLDENLVNVIRELEIHGNDHTFKIQPIQTGKIETGSAGGLCGIPGKKIFLETPNLAMLIRYISGRTLAVMQQRFKGNTPIGYITDLNVSLHAEGMSFIQIYGRQSLKREGVKLQPGLIRNIPEDYPKNMYPLILTEMREALGGV